MSLIQVTTNADEVVIKLGVKIRDFHGKVGEAVSSSVLPARKVAWKATSSKIYSRPENPYAQRSYNLLRTITASHHTDGKGHFLKVGHDPERATAPFPWAVNRTDPSFPNGLDSYSGNMRYYPSYVRQGNFFGNKVGANLDYMSDWIEQIPPILTRKLGNTIVKALAERY